MPDRLGNLLARGRGAFEARMRGTCIIVRPGKTVTDANGDTSTPMTQIYPDPTWPDSHPHADGKYYTRYPGVAFETNSDSVGVAVATSRVVIRVPFGPIFRPDDVFKSISDPDNPQLAGTVLRIASIDDQSHATAQRLLCEDFQSGVLFEED